jgi:DNA gyrase/topoisomerase IV subunit B
METKKRYQKLDPISHILVRPDMYCGSNKLKKSNEYIAVSDNEDTYKIIKKDIMYSPALLRIFIEPLSNAIDNAERSKKTSTKCTRINVKINKETGETSVWNDGDIVPIEVNDEGVYNHTMIFGQLLSGSNFDDDSERLVSGRNGCGSKITNIFSTRFEVRGLDPEKNKILVQEWDTNMRNTKGPVIKSTKLKKGYTEVTWVPDFTQFGIKGYTDDIIALYTKYVIDASMLCGVKMYLNDKEIPVKNLTEYSKLYDTETDEKLYIKTKQSEMLLTPCTEFQYISFVNGICTKQGGQHVDAWCEAIFRPLLEKFNKKGKPQINILNIKQYFRIFVVAIVDKPVFSSQEKEKLESPTIETSIKSSNINTIYKWSVCEQIEDLIKSKEMVVLKKAEKKTKGYMKIEGLDPANNAGGKYSSDCSLILCEGLSAKTYAVAGIEKGVYGKAGRDWHGCLALRGKCLNVRNASPAIIAKNNEITNIIKAVGLKIDVDYTNDENYKQLNYGRIILLCDSDCFTDNTALLIKKNNQVSIIEIQNLFDESKNIDTQLISDIEVWSDTKWVPVKTIRKKKTTKRILTINMYSGIVRCTEDHTFLLENGKEIKAKDIKVGDRLLRNRRIQNIPEINNNMKSKDIKVACRELQCFQMGKKFRKNDIIQNFNDELQYCSIYEQPFKESFNISEEEAWVWGFFFADGTCGIYTFEKDREKETEKNTEVSRIRWEKWIKFYTNNINRYTKEIIELKLKKLKYGHISKKLANSKLRLQNAIKNSKRVSKELKDVLFRTDYAFSISNCDYNKLQKALDIMKNIYKFNWTIVQVKKREEQHQTAYKLILNGGKMVEDFITYMRNRFYTKSKLKKVPDEILNNDVKIQESFLKGYYDGDGFRWGKEHKNSEGFDILGQVGAQGLCYLVERLGYSYNITEKKGKTDIFTINISKRFRRYYPGEVKAVYETDYHDRYVYDIETETGRINAGVGNMIQRQCDGLHIEGLIMNFIHSLFPSLLLREVPFVVSMKTPIVRVFRNKLDDILFYDERKFKQYALKQKNNFDKKYYKGLGTTKPEDVPDTFGLKMVEYINDENTTHNMNKVFHKNHSDDRKNWLSEYDASNYISLDDCDKVYKMNISSFIDGEMIKFSIDDCKRSIPCIIDGLKESQRKIIYSVKKKGLKHTGNSLKVAQLGGYVAEHTNYHHGEQNLYDTIVKIANEFPGSNNIPLLYRDGMFGTRIHGGKDAASARYIYTKMDMLTHLIFRQEDDVILEYREDDGDVVEPKFYVPIIPMLLVNGINAAIGSGWSCNVPNYNPIDLINCIKIWLENDGKIIERCDSDNSITSLLPQLKPWYRDFEGSIEPCGHNKFITKGIISETKPGIKTITELPIGLWTDKFKDNLEAHLESKNIKSMKNYSTPKKVNFVITEAKNGFVADVETLKLHTYLYTSNMVMIDENEKLKKFEQIDDIIDHFCKIRYEYYTKRKKYMITQLENEIKHLSNKERFIKEVIDETLIIMKVSEEDIIKELTNRKYDKDKTYDDIDGDSNSGYDYLLRMQIRTFTSDKINKLKNDILSKRDILNKLIKTSEKQLWLKDLSEFEVEYTKFLKIMKEAQPKNKKK